MPRTKIKPAVVPRFSNEADEAAWWDAHRSEVEAEIRRRMRQKSSLSMNELVSGKKFSQPITLRISKEDLATARRIAGQKGLGYQTYIKMLLRQALSANPGNANSNATHQTTGMLLHKLKTRPDSSQEIRFRSYNPYESVYPGLRVVSRETLHLIKALRTQGYRVVVEPDDGTKLNYWVEKGIREVLSDPIYALVLQIPLNLMVGLIANWLSELRRPPMPDDVKIILEFDEGGNKLRYNETGQPISDEKFRAILSALDARKRRFEESRKLIPPDAKYFVPVHLEHTGKVVGWSKGFIFDDQQRSIRVDTTRICDRETWRRIESGELRGFSIGGIISSATCLICGREYVDCEHIAGRNYEGRECIVRTTTRPAEVSIVKDPVQSIALIEKR